MHLAFAKLTLFQLRYSYNGMGKWKSGIAVGPSCLNWTVYCEERGSK